MLPINDKLGHETKKIPLDDIEILGRIISN